MYNTHLVQLEENAGLLLREAVRVLGAARRAGAQVFSLEFAHLGRVALRVVVAVRAVLALLALVVILDFVLCEMDVSETGQPNCNAE